MKRVCAWCGKEMGLSAVDPESAEITHGICSVCRLSITSYKKRTTVEILNSIEEPVYLVDSSGSVITANKSATLMHGKEIADIENHLGGDVFECEYAGLEGGCGKTVHCKTCAVRNILMDTLKTGKSYYRVPAFQRIERADSVVTLKFLITTEKAGENVLLRIDKVSDAEN